MKILAINFGGIGDEIFFLPALISLKKEFGADIVLALEPRSKSIKDLTDVIDDVVSVDIKGKNKYFELLKLVNFARKNKFDMVISSGGNKFISILLFLTGIKKRYGYYTGKLSEILLIEAVPLNKEQYACDMYHDLVSPLTKHKTHLPSINIEKQEKIPNSVLIHPGVSKMSVQKGIIKTITPEIWAEIIDILAEKGKHVILVGGPDDDECINKILGNIKTKSENFENYYGKTKNIKDLAILIAKSEKFICSDSAPLHIAVALKTQVYPIFGPTDYRRLVPKSELVVPVGSNEQCPLKPCLWEKRQTTCKDLVCLKINAQDVVNTVIK